MLKPWANSLTLRLTLSFALVGVVVLLLLGLLIRQAVLQHFRELDLQLLQSEAQRISPQLARLANNPGEEQLAAVLHNSNVEWALYRNAQRQFGGLTLPVTLLEQSGELLAWQADNGVIWHVTHVSIIHAGQPAQLFLAVDTSHHQHFMAQFWRSLTLYIVVSSLCMGLLGWLAVWRGLLPLQNLRGRAAEITARRLDTRLPLHNLPPELHGLVQTLNDMLSRLENSFQRLSDFSSDLAHELRTPVSNLLTQTQVTLSQTRRSEEYRDILASNAEELERMSRMVADMLFLAQAENQQLIPNRVELELALEVAQLFEFYEALAEEKNIQLQQVGQATVSGDRLMLRRAISNLLSNALRHTPQHGTIQVCIQRQPDHITLSICNNGPTIPLEQQSRLFSRFYRTDTARHHEGSGLGLAITRSILLAHGGEVAVSSQDGQTCFTLLFPNAT